MSGLLNSKCTSINVLMIAIVDPYDLLLPTAGHCHNKFNLEVKAYRKPAQPGKCWKIARLLEINEYQVTVFLSLECMQDLVGVKYIEGTGTDPPSLT